MATKKPKSSAKTAKSKSTKPKTTAAKTVQAPVEAPKTNTVESKEPSTHLLKGFFSKKYDGEESVLTIFKQPKFYAALIGEVIGTLLITLLIISLAFVASYTAGSYAFAIVAIFVAVYAFSGACLNPLITVGMMATRRISVIRGIMYIIAEIIGAWLGWLIFNSFHLAAGESAMYDVPAMTAIGENQFWIFTMVELLGAIIIAFFFARALKYKRSVFTFGAMIAGGIALASLVGYLISAAFFNVNNNFVFNPATALMFQIFPTAGESFGEIVGGVCQALAVYALFPMIGGVIGFYISDFVARLNGETE